MSLDYYIENDAGETLELSEMLYHEGGTYALGGSTEAELNVTYNYGLRYREVYEAAGREYPGMIDMLNGRSVVESIPDLEGLAAVLPDEPGDDYWEPTPGNAGHAIALLLQMARNLPTGTWRAEG